ncbi:hypothetical protein BC826DRAFT_286032 [Russula brevipes]|nr:hypothetical protein BC826DRAFT_286032 [Russula brevipes]
MAKLLNATSEQGVASRDRTTGLLCCPVMSKTRSANAVLYASSLVGSLSALQLSTCQSTGGESTSQRREALRALHNNPGDSTSSATRHGESGKRDPWHDIQAPCWYDCREAHGSGPGRPSRKFMEQERARVIGGVSTGSQRTRRAWVQLGE